MAADLFYSVALSVLASLAVSSLMLAINVKIVKPSLWKKGAKFRILEKKLEVYGSLLTILDAAVEKSKRHRIGNKPGLRHTLEVPKDTNRMDDLFEKNRSFIDQELLTEYDRAVLKSRAFLARAQGLSQQMPDDLAHMHKLVRQKHDDLKKEFEHHVGSKLS